MNIPRKITYKLVIRTFYDAVKGAVLQCMTARLSVIQG